jgi:hypothetical protein
MTTATPGRAALIEEFVAREALGDLLQALVNNVRGVGLHYVEPPDEIYGNNFGYEDIPNELSNDLFQKLWPGEEDYQGSEHSIASARAAMLAARILQQVAATPDYLEEVTAALVDNALNSLRRIGEKPTNAARLDGGDDA